MRRRLYRETFPFWGKHSLMGRRTGKKTKYILISIMIGALEAQRRCLKKDFLHIRSFFSGVPQKQALRQGFECN